MPPGLQRRVRRRARAGQALPCPPDEFDDLPDVLQRGLGVEQGELQEVPARDLCSGQHCLARGKNRRTDGRIQAVRPVLGQPRSVREHRPVAEDQGAQLRLSGQFEVGIGGEHGSHAGGKFDRLVEERADGIRTHDAEREPEFEGVEPARCLDALVHLVGDLGPRGCFWVQVVGVIRHVPEHGAVPDQERAGADRLEERLVEVNGDGVGQPNSVQEVPVPVGHQKPAAIGRIHVEPGAVAAGQGGELGERVHGAEVGGPGRGNYRHRHQAGGAGRRDGLGQRGRIHPVVGGAADGHDGVVAQPEHGRRFPDAEMTVLRGENPQLLQQCREPEPGVRRIELQLGHGVVAGDQEGLEVGLAAA